MSYRIQLARLPMLGITAVGLALAGSSRIQAQYDAWTTATPMPQARWGLSAETVDGVIYALGGDPCEQRRAAS
jgi:hypothetical protein